LRAATVESKAEKAWPMADWVESAERVASRAERMVGKDALLAVLAL